jgi:hypothetical protein
MRLIPPIVLLSLLAAGGGACGAPAPPPGGPSVLFISPSGEPFRGRPDQPYPVAAWFAQADANHDGQLSRQEFVADAMRFFGVLDIRKDGRIDNDEVRYYEQVLVPEVLAGANAPPPDQGSGDDGGSQPKLTGPRRDGAAPYGLLGEPEPVTASNLSFSGSITPADFQRRAEQRFARLDTAATGYLTLAGLPRTLDQRAGARRR